MLNTCLSLLLLRAVPFDRTAFPSWQPAAAITLLGALNGLALPTQADGLSGWVLVPLGVLAGWALYGVQWLFMRSWLRRVGGWDGAGSLHGLLAASFLTALGPLLLLTRAQAPGWLSLCAAAYGMWVMVRALTGAIPGAGWGVCLAGLLLAGVAALALPVVLAVLIWVLF